MQFIKVSLATVLIFFVACSAAYAQATYTWNGSQSSVWTNSANWTMTNGATNFPNSAGCTVVIGSAPTNRPTIAASYAVGTFTLNGGNVTMTGGTLTISTALTVAGTITMSGSTTVLTVNAPLSITTGSISIGAGSIVNAFGSFTATGPITGTGTLNIGQNLTPVTVSIGTAGGAQTTISPPTTIYSSGTLLLANTTFSNTLNLNTSEVTTHTSYGGNIFTGDFTLTTNGTSTTPIKDILLAVLKADSYEANVTVNHNAVGVLKMHNLGGATTYMKKNVTITRAATAGEIWIAAASNTGTGTVEINSANNGGSLATLTLKNLNTSTTTGLYTAFTGNYNAFTKITANVRIDATSVGKIGIGGGYASTQLLGASTIQFTATPTTTGLISFRRFSSVIGADVTLNTGTSMSVEVIESTDIQGAFYVNDGVTGVTFNNDVTGNSGTRFKGIARLRGARLNINNCYFDGPSILTQTGSSPTSSFGGNSYTNTMSIINEGTSSLTMGTLSPDNITADLTVVASNATGGSIYLFQHTSGQTTTLNCNISLCAVNDVNTISLGGVSTTGANLTAGKTIKTFTNTTYTTCAGTILLYQITQSFLSSANTHDLQPVKSLNITNSTLGLNTNVKSKNFVFANSNFLGQNFFEHTSGTANAGSSGSNYTGNTTFLSNGTASSPLYISSNGSVPDTYSGDLTVILKSPSTCTIGFNSVPVVSGDIVVAISNVNTTTASTITISKATHAVTKTIKKGADGLYIGTLNINSYVQNDPDQNNPQPNPRIACSSGQTALTLVSDGSKIVFGYGAVIYQRMYVTGPNVAINGGIYNCSVDVTTTSAGSTNISWAVASPGTTVTFVKDLNLTLNHANTFSMATVSMTERYIIQGNATIVNNSAATWEFYGAAAGITEFGGNLSYTCNHNNSNALHAEFGYAGQTSGGICRFNGTTGLQTITTTTPGPLKFNRVEINNPYGVTLSGSMQIMNNIQGGAGYINLQQGILNTTATNLLIVNDNCTASSVAASFVNGPMRKDGDDPFVYPVGKVIGATRIYAPIEVVTITASGLFQAEYLVEDDRVASPDYNMLDAPNTPLVAPLLDVSECERWSLNRISYPSTVPVLTIKLKWNTAYTCSSIIPTALRVALFNGTNWVDNGNNNYVNNNTVGDITGTATPNVANLSFTFGYSTLLLLNTQAVNLANFSITSGSDYLNTNYKSSSTGSSNSHRFYGYGITRVHPIPGSTSLDWTINNIGDNDVQYMRALLDASLNPTVVKSQYASSYMDMPDELYKVTTSTHTLEFYKDKVKPTYLKVTVTGTQGTAYNPFYGAMSVSAPGFTVDHFYVYDKTNTLVYSGTTNSWNGKNTAGTDLPENPYRFEISFNNGTTSNIYKGHIFLNRTMSR